VEIKIPRVDGHCVKKKNVADEVGEIYDLSVTHGRGGATSGGISLSLIEQSELFITTMTQR
jgi:hypothetical protein